jgi:hypothetical protein
MIPFDVVNSDYTGNGAMFDQNAAGLTLSGSSPTGSASATVQAAGSGGTSSLKITLSATVSGELSTPAGALTLGPDKLRVWRGLTGEDALINIPVTAPAVREFYRIFRVPVQ